MKINVRAFRHFQIGSKQTGVTSGKFGKLQKKALMLFVKICESRVKST
jgi:hypothetical protein